MMTAWSAWWAWALAALLLGLIEAVVPAWVALGFAIGAGLVSVGLLTGVLGPVVALSGGYGFGVLLLLFAVFSLIAWVTLRKVFGPMAGETKTFEEDINE